MPSAGCRIIPPKGSKCSLQVSISGNFHGSPAWSMTERCKLQELLGIRLWAGGTTGHSLKGLSRRKVPSAGVLGFDICVNEASV